MASAEALEYILKCVISMKDTLHLQFWNVRQISWKKPGQSFDNALVSTRPGNLFTTHTAVAAGFDLFSSNLIDQYMGEYAEKKLGISRQQLLASGSCRCSKSVREVQHGLPGNKRQWCSEWSKPSPWRSQPSYF